MIVAIKNFRYIGLWYVSLIFLWLQCSEKKIRFLGKSHYLIGWLRSHLYHQSTKCSFSWPADTVVTCVILFLPQVDFI